MIRTPLVDSTGTDRPALAQQHLIAVIQPDRHLMRRTLTADINLQMQLCITVTGIQLRPGQHIGQPGRRFMQQ